MEGGVRIQIQKVARVGDQKHGMHPPSFGGGGGVEVSKILESHCGVGGGFRKFYFGGGERKAVEAVCTFHI